MYFSTKNYSSFIRQLNIYGFSKTRSKKVIEFSHEHLQRGNKKELEKIKIKKKEKKISNEKNYEDLKSDFLKLSKNVNKLKTTVSLLTVENKGLLKNNEGLFKKLKMEREEFQLDLLNLITLFFNSVKFLHPDLLDKCKEVMQKNKIFNDMEMEIINQSDNFSQLLPIISKKIFNDRKAKTKLFACLIDVFKKNIRENAALENNIMSEMERVLNEKDSRMALSFIKESYRSLSSKLNRREYL